jgi:GNAT superfamily N-acetyltransferase
MPSIRIVPAQASDVPVILQMIRGLAEYEQLTHEVTATEDVLRESLFGPHPAAEVVLAYAGDAPIGFALFFHNFSTFLGRQGLYLEDLFVVPEWRGKGIGTRLFAHVASIAAERRSGRMEWAVLDWNESAIAFYRHLGAQILDDWRICRLTGDALERGSAKRA